MARAGLVAHSRSTIRAREKRRSTRHQNQNGDGPQLQQRRQQRGAHQNGDDEGQRPISADPAVLHDLEAFLARGAAAETIGHIGQAIFVKRARQHGGNGDGEQACKQIRQPGQMGKHQRCG